MGKEKGGFLTPKAIANRIKSKGLQKLRWFCQMCNKQCRDENGFKCHLTSESHQRQLLLVAETPEKFVDSFSREFADMFLELLRRRFGTKRVHANVVYQEYISDREHTHMNSTEWETLTDFVKWLGREGHCVVDETEKGWFIAYVSRDAEAIRRMEAATKKEKMERDDDERRAEFIRGQIERARESGPTECIAAPTVLSRNESDEKIALKLIPSTASSSAALTASCKTSTLLRNVLVEESKKAAERLRRDDAMSTTSSSSSRSSKLNVGTKKRSAIEEIMESEKTKRAKMETWLHEGIVVKVVDGVTDKKIYKQKGIVREVLDDKRAIVEFLESSARRIELRQTQLETVLPAIGRRVLVVNGAHRGSTAELLVINEPSYSCSIRLQRGGRIIENVAYEDVCKLAEQT